MVENGFTPGFQGEKATVFGESCLCKTPRKKVAWENCGGPFMHLLVPPLPSLFATHLNN